MGFESLSLRQFTGDGMGGYQKKNRQLGMNVSTASNRLRKLLLFDLAGKLNLLKCYRCGGLIKIIEEFSVEHKIRWQDSKEPAKLFFDLDNIAFSHLRCNIKDSRTNNVPHKGRMTHGTYTGYHYHKCRCELCKEAYAMKRKEWPSRQ